MDKISDKKIVVLGAGFGGLRAATLLAKKGLSVTLIDKNAFQTYTPILYEIAVTPKEMANYIQLEEISTFPIKDSLGDLPVNFINSEVKKIDHENRRIILENQTVDFDYLIIALGSEPNYFNIPGLKENSIGFKTFLDAVKIRDHLTGVPFLNDRGKPTVVIGGAGATGVELAGEIQFSGTANVTLIQRPPDILNEFGEKIRKMAKRRLDKLGVKIILDSITSVKEKSLALQNKGEVYFDTLIWTGGTKSNHLLNDINLRKDELCQLEVTREMKCRPTDNIYAIGDNCCFINPLTNHPTPGLAQVALKQAEIVVKNILNQEAIYKPKDYPYILPIGGKYALCQYKNFVIEGFWAWTLKGLVELIYLLQIMNWGQAFKIWLKGLKIFIANDKLG